MNLSKTERNIMKLFFHPRLIKYLDKYIKSMVRHPSPHRHVEFACKHSHSARQHMCENGHLQLREWMRELNLHIVTGNCGVIDINNTRVLALDMILAHPPGNESTTSNSTLTLCTVVLNAHASSVEIRRAHHHTQKLHSLMNTFYLPRCRSVLLVWNVDETFTEVWFCS
jgi:hypothetical protein